MFFNTRDEYSNPLRKLFEETDNKQRLEIGFGSIGTKRHEYGAVNKHQVVGLERRCTDIAATYGRPFTYKYGESLDRLESVSFD